jgi:hypothetical protein
MHERSADAVAAGLARTFSRPMFSFDQIWCFERRSWSYDEVPLKQQGMDIRPSVFSV